MRVCALFFLFIFSWSSSIYCTTEIRRVANELQLAKKRYKSLVASNASRSEIRVALANYKKLIKRFKTLAARRSSSRTASTNRTNTSSGNYNSSNNAVAVTRGSVSSGLTRLVTERPFTDEKLFDPGVAVRFLKPEKQSWWSRVKSFFRGSAVSDYNKGYKALRKGKLEEAERHFKNSLKKNPDHFGSNFALAALYKHQKSDKSSRYYSRLSSISPTSASGKSTIEKYALYEKALKMSQGIEFDKTIALWRRLGALGISEKTVSSQIAWAELQKSLGVEKSKSLRSALANETGGKKYKALGQYRVIIKGLKKGKGRKVIQDKIDHLVALADANFHKVLRERSEEYIKAGVKFKIGGYDTVDVYKEKMAKGASAGMHSNEYFKKYVNPKTWKFRSRKAEKEYRAVAGIDCAGFLQRNWQYLYRKAGMKYPVRESAKFSGGMLFKKSFVETMPITKESKFPPEGIKAGDIIRLGEHGDGIWNHFFFFDHVDSKGRVWIRDMASKGPGYRIMPDWYRPHLVRWARYKGADEVRERVGLAS